MQTYELTIDERQRQIIEIALKMLPFAAIAEVSQDPMTDGPAETIEMLHGMFKELPDVEAKLPGVNHGFCL